MSRERSRPDHVGSDQPVRAGQENLGPGYEKTKPPSMAVAPRISADHSLPGEAANSDRKSPTGLLAPAAKKPLLPASGGMANTIYQKILDLVSGFPPGRARWPSGPLPF